MTHYIAFLRGINVGGNALIKMADLAKVFSSLKFKNVRTYIASGNVLFEAAVSDGGTLELKIEKALLKSFGQEVSVMVRTVPEVERIVQRDPFAEKTGDAHWKLYVVFLKEEPVSALKKSLLVLSGELETYALLGREVYSTIHKNHPKPTFSGNFIEKQLKVRATARNWNTVRKILQVP
jgi:uncharacterized protein (DUF1697 family)